MEKRDKELNNLQQQEQIKKLEKESEKQNKQIQKFNHKVTIVSKDIEHEKHLVSYCLDEPSWISR